LVFHSPLFFNDINDGSCASTFTVVSVG
jgi:hypothetical protein